MYFILQYIFCREKLFAELRFSFLEAEMNNPKKSRHNRPTITSEMIKTLPRHVSATRCVVDNSAKTESVNLSTSTGGNFVFIVGCELYPPMMQFNCSGAVITSFAIFLPTPFFESLI